MFLVCGCGQEKPRITQLDPAKGEYDKNLIIKGEHFMNYPNQKAITINGADAPQIMSWSDQMITVMIPRGAALTGKVHLSADGVASDPVDFSIKAPAPSLQEATPGRASVGQLMTIKGKNLGREGKISFGGVAATAKSWTDTTIEVPVPEAAAPGSIVVNVGGQESNPVPFELIVPVLNSISPESALPGRVVTLKGVDFGTDMRSGKIVFGTAEPQIKSWTDTKIEVVAPDLPDDREDVSVGVIVKGCPSNQRKFKVPQPPKTGIISEAGMAFEFQDLVIDPDGFPQIACSSMDMGGAMILSWNGTSWAPTVFSDPSFKSGNVQHFVGWSMHAAIDQQGNTHATCLDFFDSGVVYLKRSADGKPHVERIVPSMPQRDYFAVVVGVDPKGVPAVTLTGERAGLKLFTRTDKGWIDETLDARGGEGDVSAPPDIVYDKQGTPHIAFFEAQATTLSYVTKGDGKWSVTVVDPGPKVGDGASIALDSKGNPAISYHDFSGTGTLKVATKGPSGWKVEVVDATPGAARHTSLKFDADDKMHIIYDVSDATLKEIEFQGKKVNQAEYTPKGLRHATNASGAWKINEKADASSPSGWRPVLGIDKKGRKWFAYHDLKEKKLRLGMLK
ncbi:MAG: IPT/TIG domain-containing protein [Candidatus Riflebacteria bacterium]|nr:IPT/TIG domain-containing protein [Candidatus Riflebacteria bacterium]